MQVYVITTVGILQIYKINVNDIFQWNKANKRFKLNCSMYYNLMNFEYITTKSPLSLNCIEEG